METARCSTPDHLVIRYENGVPPTPSAPKRKTNMVQDEDKEVYIWWMSNILKINEYFSRQLVNDYERRVWCEREWAWLSQSKKKEFVRHARSVMQNVQNILINDVEDVNSSTEDD